MTTQTSTQHTGKVWLITSGASPLGFSIARQALRQGDSIAVGIPIDEPNRHQRILEETADNNETVDECDVEYLEIWGGKRCLLVQLDISCQPALTETAFAGTLEETEEWQARAQFEVAYFGAVNIIKTVIGEMRRRGTGGHIINVTSLTAHMGTPGLSLLTAAHHALEGFSEALSFEIAPFNIKVTIIEPSLATHLLTTSVHLPPSHTAYAAQASPIRALLSTRTPNSAHSSQSNVSDILTPSPLPIPLQLEVIGETVRVIMAIAGKDNPPGRVIVGGEESAEDGEGGVQSVKERMKTVSEELEEFLECGLSVDTGADVGTDGPGLL